MICYIRRNFNILLFTYIRKLKIFYNVLYWIKQFLIKPIAVTLSNKINVIMIFYKTLTIKVNEGIC